MLKHYEQHERGTDLLKAVFNLQLLKLENGIPTGKVKVTHSVLEYNSFILRFIVDAICFIIGEITPINEKYNLLEVSDCINYLKLLRSNGSRVCAVDDAIALLYKSSKIVNDPRLQVWELLTENSSGPLAFKNILISLLLHEQGFAFNKVTLDYQIMIFKLDESLLCNKSVHKLMKTFCEYNLSDVFTQVYKLAEFILSLLFLPPSKNIEYKTTKFKLINKYSYIPQISGTLSGETSVLCIEKQILQDLQC